MKITLKGNTAKVRKFCPAIKDKPSMLYMNVAEKIKRHDGSEKTVWYKVKVAYKYAELINRQIPENTSRFMMLEGHVVDEPAVYEGKAQVVIWADQITWLDDKWPADTAPAADPAEEPELPTEIDDLECPW